MTEILKGALGGAWTWLIAFVFPASLFLGAVGLLAKLQDPDPDLVRVWLAWTSESRLLLTGFLAATIGMVLLGLNKGILQVLEGYVGVRQIKVLWDSMSKRQLQKKHDLTEKLKADAGSLDSSFLVDQLMRYPADDRQVGPTRFGNAVRSFETYGATAFGLDTQTLWYEVIASAPDSARAEESAARAYVDFLGNLILLSLIFVGIGTYSLISDPSLADVVALIIALILVPVWYLLAVHAAHEWAGAVRAIVNLGRLQLATNLDLILPRTLADETDMWRNLVWLVREGPDPDGDPISKYRKGPADTQDS